MRVRDIRTCRMINKRVPAFLLVRPGKKSRQISVVFYEHLSRHFNLFLTFPRLRRLSLCVLLTRNVDAIHATWEREFLPLLFRRINPSGV